MLSRWASGGSVLFTWTGTSRGRGLRYGEKDPIPDGAARLATLSSAGAGSAGVAGEASPPGCAPAPGYYTPPPQTSPTQKPAVIPDRLFVFVLFTGVSHFLNAG